MSQAFPIERLYALMGEVFGLRDFQLQPHMSAADVPGWDSLHHAVLIMRLEAESGLDLSGVETAELPDIAALHAAIAERLAG
ncbi:acyl carrier protein [Brevundimonas sp.]|uniref:acyl carrier protein n=1 Tax=Brevundimonas sp. TaxID=1871086 RepID=UPI0025F2A1F4|nr:acyl carrier protein [Brevundimonas sp.]